MANVYTATAKVIIAFGDQPHCFLEPLTGRAFCLHESVLKACGLVPSQIAKGAKIEFDWEEAQPTHRVVRVRSIDGDMTHVSEKDLERALNFKRPTVALPEREKPQRGKIPSGYKRKQGQKASKPQLIRLRAGDRVVGSFLNFDFQKGFGFVRVVVVRRKPTNVVVQEGVVTTSDVFVHVKHLVPVGFNEGEFAVDMEAGCLFDLVIIDDSGKCPAGQVTGYNTDYQVVGEQSADVVSLAERRAKMA